MKERLKITGRVIILSNVLVLWVSVSFAQQVDATGFLKHLSNLGYYEEALQYLHQIDDKGLIGSDSIHYLRGKFYYYQKELGPSIDAFQQVSSTSDLFSESQLLASYQEIYAGHWVKGTSHLENLSLRDSLLDATRYLMIGGSHLLTRDMAAYERTRLHFEKPYRQLSQAQQQLALVKMQIEAHKRKSPALAGLLSTLVPGMGQFYNGNIGQGSMALITIGVFGLQTWESYRRDGLKSVRTILFGSLFSGFYIANIWGATLGVQVKEQEFNDQINETILVSMHIPLRFLFD